MSTAHETTPLLPPSPSRAASSASYTSLRTPPPSHPNALSSTLSTTPAKLMDVLARTSLTIENSGSAARDHLASERTWLAWLRTSLSLASIGVAVAQLFALQPQRVRLEGWEGDRVDGDVRMLLQALKEQLEAMDEGRSNRRFAKPLGGTMIAVGIVILLLGVQRYFLVQSHLTRGIFPPARQPVLILSALVGALAVACFAVVLASR